MRTLLAVLVLVLASWSGLAAAADPARRVVVLAIQPAVTEDVPITRTSNEGTIAGAAIGSAIGAFATRKKDWQTRSAAVVAGGAVGSLLGRKNDHERGRGTTRLQGYDVVVRDAESGRLTSLFLRTHPPVGVGEEAYIVGGWGRERLVRMQ